MNIKYHKVCEAIIKGLEHRTFGEDLSDLGNDIGMMVAEHLSDDDGFEKDDFIAGIEHGISTVDGTHG